MKLRQLINDDFVYLLIINEDVPDKKVLLSTRPFIF